MNKNNIEKSTFSSRLTLLTITLTFTFFACNDDDHPEQNLEEVETATLLSLRTEGADGRIYYMAVYEEIPNEPDLSTMVELGPGFRVYAFGENPYTWDGNASNLTKWNVDRTNLNVSEAEVMSLAGLGISGDLGPPAFFSDEQAYFFEGGQCDLKCNGIRCPQICKEGEDGERSVYQYPPLPSYPLPSYGVTP